jgi:hypothetical protein
MDMQVHSTTVPSWHCTGNFNRRSAPVKSSRFASRAPFFFAEGGDFKINKIFAPVPVTASFCTMADDRRKALLELAAKRRGDSDNSKKPVVSKDAVAKNGPGHSSKTEAGEKPKMNDKFKALSGGGGGVKSKPSSRY